MSENQEQQNPDVAAIPKNPLESVPGLEGALSTLCTVPEWRETEPTLSIEQIATHMVDNKNVQEAVFAYLKYGGDGYNRDKDIANHLRETLMLEELDILRKKVEQVKPE